MLGGIGENQSSGSDLGNIQNKRSSWVKYDLICAVAMFQIAQTLAKVDYPFVGQAEMIGKKSGVGPKFLWSTSRMATSESKLSSQQIAQRRSGTFRSVAKSRRGRLSSTSQDLSWTRLKVTSERRRARSACLMWIFPTSILVLLGTLVPICDSLLHSSEGQDFQQRLGHASLVDNADVLKELGVEIRSHSELWKEISALVGTSVVIPCNISSPFRDDHVRLVLWFKGNSTKPFYSYDNRDERSSPQHWSNDTMLGGRAGFQLLAIDSANLMLREVKIADEGRYKCRVDYKQAQTSTSVVQLKAIVHSQKPRILVHASSSDLEKSTDDLGTNSVHPKFVELDDPNDPQFESQDHFKYLERPQIQRIGPYQVGDSLKLKCLVLGGHPSPNVTWSRLRVQEATGPSEVIDETFHVSHNRRHHGENLVKNILEMANLRRVDHLMTLICQSANNALEPGPQTSVVVEMILQPARVKITPLVMSNQANGDSIWRLGGEFSSLAQDGTIFSEGKARQIQCVVHGAQPNHPTVSWWVGGRKLPPRTFTVDHLASGNVTTSILTFRPEAGDDGKELTCKAFNRGRAEAGKEQRPPLKGSPLPPWKRERSGHLNDWKSSETDMGPEPLGVSDSMTMRVLYMPRSRLILGPTLNGTNIKEGDDVYFECIVDSRPPPANIEWTHNGQTLVADVGNGVIMSNQSLVLQSLSRERSGQYSCTAFNSEGRNTSRDLTLKIKYKPFCKPGLPSIYGAISGHTIEIVCQVEANPLFDLKFEWTFNSSTGNIRMPQALIKDNQADGASVLQFTPKSEMDLGTLLCRASNPIGVQAEPCIFHLIAARRPNPVANCSAANKSYAILKLKCVPGFDGGLSQNFTMEIRNALDHGLVFNQTTHEEPAFRATGLKSATGYIVSIYSINARGTSDRLNFHVYTSNEMDNPNILETNESALTNSSTFNESNNFLRALIIGGIALSLVVIILFGAICVRRIQLSLRASPAPSVPTSNPEANSHGFITKESTPDDPQITITENPQHSPPEYSPRSSLTESNLPQSHITRNPVPKPDLKPPPATHFHMNPLDKYHHVDFFDPEETPPEISSPNPSSLYLKLDRESNV